ncbi:site-specific DNA-methyltransferase [Methanospirillum hungatei]|uniref:DNA-methyltransferase n=1 Tax=Methanospirillum hungatei TaxID=2203 RepID=UPI0026EB1ADC|nr:site-specific DNA-methyltransferase [Methanospirillum hungatei]MCA1916420.1 site-specific DNA-methyltransferase [Methanospirillum hungatei]
MKQDSLTPKQKPVLIEIPLSRDLLQKELSVLHSLNRKYSGKEIALDVRDQTLIAQLWKLDPSQYENSLNEFITRAGLNDQYISGLDNPFSALLEKILSIGSYGIRYRKRIYAGYADERKVTGRKEKEYERGSFFYAEGNSFSHHTHPLPDEYLDQIICGDSEEILSRLPDNCIDLIITSPPYNFGLEYSSSGDSAHWQAYLDKLYRVFTQGIRVLKYGGRFIVNVQPLFSDYIPLHHLISSFFMNQKMIWKGEILWEKNNYNCKYTSWGSWKSPSSPYLKYTWEFIEIFCKGTLKKSGKSEDADISDEEFKSWVVAKWSIGPERRMKHFNHPAMFPEELVERCLKLFSFQGDIILDPFNGAGTTTAVAARTNRHFIGLDISSEYCDRARERLLQIPASLDRKNEKPKKISEKSIFTSSLETPKRRGRPPKQRVLTEESSQHHLDRFYSGS